MADNVPITAGSGTTIATDEISDAGVANGAQVQRVKAGFGADNAYNDPIGGAGNVTAGTQRVTLATDDANAAAIKTAAELIDDAIYVDDADWTATTSKHALIGGVYQSTQGTITDGDTGPIRVDAHGNVITTINAGSFTLADGVSNTGNLPVDPGSNYTGVLSWGYAYNGSTWDRIRGTSSDGLLVNLGSNNDVTVNSGTVTANAGTNLNTSALALESGGNLATLAGIVSGSEAQVDVVAALPAGTNVIGDVGISGARTSGGTTIFRSIDLDESEEEVKATAGQVYWIHAMNMASSVRYLKFYNATAASVTVGTTTPVMTFALPTSGDTNGAGFTLAVPSGIAFSTAITVAATTGVADNDTGAPGANEVIVNLGYA